MLDRGCVRLDLLSLFLNRGEIYGLIRRAGSIALAVWFMFELVIFWAEIEQVKKQKLAEAEGPAEQNEQLQPMQSSM